ncbi:M48 family metalloprotease [Emticicia sp. BO119]|uniref:M48 family metalloprotease n=1 Tax=Emticicia sp. BO119 TaxID=2757768 RepID=UPI0015F1129C|nr:M48 family metalloprotease [Emticicia sp. BO119]MBA4850931.1 M48 family metalloprotease [Emticicia sp. BO119]
MISLPYGFLVLLLLFLLLLYFVSRKSNDTLSNLYDRNKEDHVDSNEREEFSRVIDLLSVYWPRLQGWYLKLTQKHNNKLSKENHENEINDTNNEAEEEAFVNTLKANWLRLQEWYLKQAQKHGKKQRRNLSTTVVSFVIINILNLLFAFYSLNEVNVELTKFEKFNRVFYNDYDNLEEIIAFPLEEIPVPDQDEMYEILKKYKPTSDEAWFAIKNYNEKQLEKIDKAYQKLYQGIIAFIFGLVITFIQIYPFLFFRFENYLKNTSYKKIDRNSFQSIWTSIDYIAKSMNIDMPVNLYYLQENNFEAHVINNEEHIDLFLSRQMISFHSQDIDKFQAIIAHEFGHVIQGDTKFLLSSVYSLRKSFVISIIGLIVTFLIGIDFWSFVALSVASFFFYTNFVERRHKSEYLADIASLCYLQNDKILDVLNLSVTKDSPYYPTKIQRINNLNKILHRFQSDNADNNLKYRVEDFLADI